MLELSYKHPRTGSGVLGRHAEWWSCGIRCFLGWGLTLWRAKSAKYRLREIRGRR
jgi:hypothetical protein